MKKLVPLLARFVFAGCLSLALCLIGCQSPSGGKRRFASVTISNHSAANVVRTTVEVFRADGYHDLVATPEDMVFEKTGTAWNNVAYGGWTDSKPVTVRVRAGVEPQPNGDQRLWCEAYMVGDAGDALFEEQHKLTTVRRGPYQALLNQVADRLK
jgi:hypothetical protein